MNLPAEVGCYLVRKQGQDEIVSGVERRPTAQLPTGDVLVRVRYSSLNYKDAMAASGHAGVVKNFPHVPGIDACGTVIHSERRDLCDVGDEVIVTGHGMGADRWGGWAELIRVPAEWVVKLPEGLSPQESMILGTAGFTAAQCVDAVVSAGAQPDDGDIVVTGATGGVGILAIKLLAVLGYRVTAVSGKANKHDWLKSHGAASVIGRDNVNETSGRPLLSTRWAGGVDTVGGNTLATVLRGTKNRGCVAACGLVGGADLPITVYPFILRGVTLAGIDSAWCPRDVRLDLWNRLANEWKIRDLDRLMSACTLDSVGDHVAAMLRGESLGRTVVVIHDKDES